MYDFKNTPCNPCNTAVVHLLTGPRRLFRADIYFMSQLINQLIKYSFSQEEANM